MIYWGSVALFQQLLDPFTSPSSLTVAGSTLLVAALFRPLRQRIQRIVDRHFFRSRYNATTTIDAFNAQVRDAVDLDTLLTSLQAIAHETMQPTTVSIWIQNFERPQRASNNPSLQHDR